MGRLELQEQISQAIRKFNLFSDVFMKVVFRDPLACEHVIRVLSGNPDVKIVSVRTEYEISKVSSHDSRLDVLAEDQNEKFYNLELQRKEYLDHAKRVRFYNAMVDSEMLEKGKDYDTLPDLNVYYISETDIWKKKKTCYQVKKTLSSEEMYKDGISITYVNAEIDDNSETARLMKYFKTADPYDNSQGDLSKRVYFLKCEEEGKRIMCKVTDELIEIGKEIGQELGESIGEERSAKRIVLRMAGRGKTLGEIIDNTGVSLELAKRWLGEAAAVGN